MKNKSNFLMLSALVGGLLFHFLFWNEGLGLNLAIYSLYLILITYLNPEVVKSRKFKIFGSTNLLAATLVVVNNSDLSIITYYTSLVLFVGFSHNQQLRTVFSALATVFLQLITLPFNAIRNLNEVTFGKFNLKPVFKLIKYIFIPIVIITLFICLYSAASSMFSHYAEAVINHTLNFLDNIFGFIFKDLTLPRFIFFCFGLVVTSGLILTFSDKNLERAELKCNEKLLRVRSNNNQKTAWHDLIKTFSLSALTKKMALKTEFITAIISFLALNSLLLILNLIDITTLWFGYKPSGNFSADLHNGTNALIFSIVLAMAVIIYFFRGNLNFYSKRKTLRILAFAWIAQNFILIISVFIRDGYYIEFYGLTHKRIGVLVFAILCIVGLATVYIKVAKQKTLFYLLKVNGNIWFGLLLLFSTINWDVFVVKYNLSQSNKISLDVDYLLSLTDKTLPVLDKNRAKLHLTEKYFPIEANVISPKRKEDHTVRLNRRIDYFKDRYKKSDWPSWNLQDWNTAKYFRVE